MNYHTLADFRVGCADLLDQLLSEHLAALAKAGLIDLDTLAQDGVRIRASAGVLAWRVRMASEAGKVQYKPRSICECIHARWRNWDLRQLTVRGIEKVRAVVLCYALTNNILQGHRLASA